MLIYANLSLLDRTWCILEWFLAQLSWKLKWALLIACCPSSILASFHPSVCLSVYPSANFSHFHLLRRTTGPISTKLGTKYPLVKGNQVCSNEWPGLFPRGDNYKIRKKNGWISSTRGDSSEIVNFYWKYLKIFFSRTAWLIFNQIWHRSSLGKGDSSLFKWRATPFSKRRQLRNSKNTLTKF